jgi:hypothetical protein
MDRLVDLGDPDQPQRGTFGVSARGKSDRDTGRERDNENPCDD